MIARLMKILRGLWIEDANAALLLFSLADPTLRWISIGRGRPWPLRLRVDDATTLLTIHASDAIRDDFRAPLHVRSL